MAPRFAGLVAVCVRVCTCWPGLSLHARSNRCSNRYLICRIRIWSLTCLRSMQAYHASAITGRACVQDVIAPFVLENLNCTGSEARLVDCSVTTDVSFYNVYAQDGTYEFVYATEFESPVTCDFADGSFAFVACGAEDRPGALPCMHMTAGVHACWCCVWTWWPHTTCDVRATAT